MLKTAVLAVVGMLGILGIGTMARADDHPAPPPGTAPGEVLKFTMKDIDGKDVDLSKYKGRVILMVNVASKCGNTPQYKSLEAIYEKYKDKGFVILGFPANNFGAQEPGTDGEIKEFCTANYNVTFPIFSKISVKGDDIAPLYKTLTEFKSEKVTPGSISWNFEKFLIGRDGAIVDRFAPRTKPDSDKVIAAIEAELDKKKE